MNRTLLALTATLLATAACDDTGTSGERPFILGTDGNNQVALVVNSTGKTLTLFRAGDPKTTRQIPFGSSSSVTPTGLSVAGRRAAVPLGNAASVALIDLEGLRITRYFLFPGGNATGSAFADDTTVLAANFIDDYVGRFTVNQAGDSIRQRVNVAPAPTDIVMVGGRAAVISSNLNAAYASIGNGVVTFLDPRTLQVAGTVTTGGTNSGAGAVGPDGLLYVVNTGDYVADGSVTIINPATLRAEATVGGFGAGPGSIHIDRDGLAYVSGFGTGTIVWNTRTRTFVRDARNPLCARTAAGACRGAFDVSTDVQGNVYQAFFGSASEGLAPYVFVYRAGTYALADSVAAGNGPAAIELRTF